MAIDGSLIGGIIGGLGSFFGAKSQADAVTDAAKNQIIALRMAGDQLNTAFDEIIGEVRANPLGYAGSRVKAAAFEPTSLQGSQQQAVSANAANLGDILSLISRANTATLQSDYGRAQSLFPGLGTTLGNLSQSAASLSGGQLPFDVAQNVIGGRQTAAGNLNVPGGSAPASLRDLGLSSIDATNQGASLFQNILQAADQFISPVSRQTAAPQFFASPQESTQLNLQQAQLSQNAQQNAYNLQAQPDPSLNLLMQLMIQQATGRAGTEAQIAGLGTPVVPSTMGIAAQTLAQPLGNAIGNLFGGSQQSPFSQGYGAFNQSAASFNPYAYNAAAQSYNSNLAGGAAPKAIVVT